MPLHADDVAAIATQVTASVADIVDILPGSQTVTEAVETVGPRLLAEMQTALRERYGELASPLVDELRELLVTGVIGEVLLLGYRQLQENEKAWPDEWRMRFRTGLAELATGVSQLATDVRRSGRAAGMTSRPQVFTDEALGQVF